MPRVILSLGSNIGDRVLNCRSALEEISGFAEIRRVSSVYETEPVGHENQPDFINCAAQIDTALSPHDLLSRLREVEKVLGRVRDERWRPRTIDIDIIFYDDLILDTEELTIPHVSAHARRFVLEPVCEIDPMFVHPGFGVRVYLLLNDIDDDKKVVKTGEPSTIYP